MPKVTKKRAPRGSVMANIVTIFLMKNLVSTDDIKNRLGISSKAMSVTLDRLVKKKVIKRVELGVYSLRG